MSKTKESLFKHEDQQILYMSKFIDHLYENVTSIELKEGDIKKSEKDAINKERELANNRNYYPIKGA